MAFDSSDPEHQRFFFPFSPSVNPAERILHCLEKDDLEQFYRFNEDNIELFNLKGSLPPNQRLHQKFGWIESWDLRFAKHPLIEELTNMFQIRVVYIALARLEPRGKLMIHTDAAINFHIPLEEKPSCKILCFETESPQGLLVCEYEVIPGVPFFFDATKPHTVVSTSESVRFHLIFWFEKSRSWNDLLNLSNQGLLLKREVVQSVWSL